MRKTSFILMLVLLHSIPQMLLAQEKFGLEIGGYGGFEDWKDRTFQVNAPQATSPIDIGFGYDDKVAYGVRFNLLSRGYWGGELDYNYQRNTATLSRQSFTPVQLEGAIHHFFYNTVFYPTRYESVITPFATAGIGMAAYGLDDETRAKAANPRIYGIGNLIDLDKRFAFNYGGGVKAVVSSGVGLRFDFRHNFSDVPSYGLPKESSQPNAVVLPIQGKLQNTEFSVGIYFRAWK